MTLTAPREHATTVATQGQAILGGDSRFAVAPGERVPEGHAGAESHSRGRRLHAPTLRAGPPRGLGDQIVQQV